MSAVVSFVSDVVESVVDAVGDVVETVVDVVEDAVEFVGDTVEAIVNDPIPTLLSIAGAAIGIPPPVTMAAVTAARGGDLEDIVLSAGVAYLAPQASNALSSTLSASIGDAIVNQTVSDIVVDSVSKGLVSGTIAEIRGGDFEDGFAGGFTGTLVNSSVGEFTNEFISPGIQDMLADSGLETSTINSLVKEGTRAVSAGLTAEITGRGDFDDAFINSVQNSTINVGTNYAVNTIGDQFRSTEQGLQTVEKEKETESDLLSFNDYFSLDTTRDTDTTGAGIVDSLVEEVAVSDIGTDSGATTDTLATTGVGSTDFSNLETTFGGSNLGSTTNIDNLLASTDATEIIDEFSDEDEPQGSVTVESLPGDVQDLYTEYGIGDQKEETPVEVAKETDYTDYTPIVVQTDAQEPTGGLTTIKAATELPTDITEEDIVFSGGKADIDAEESLADKSQIVSTKKVVDPYAGLDENIANLAEDSTVDVTGRQGPSIIDGGLNVLSNLAGRTGLVDSGGGMSTDKLVTGALNQFLRPAIRTGLTRAIKGTPTKTLVKRPVQKKSPLTTAQLQQARGAGQQKQAPRTIDMSKVINKPVAKVAPPKKVDVKTLTPISDVASLTSILTGGKG
jgi:hypothetical protein